ncbi:MFS transporter [Amycolatopsis nigrescens]|uniref:MFS transporter n=1 Tax=Amycolatopsis nigrescens TaxID=381445 RepID=UPI00058C43EE|nr:MFS transporter [Amycolatopsis nigrescens]
MAALTRVRVVPDWLVVTLACFGSFVVVLDTMIVNLALPAIGRELGFSGTDLQWVVSGYLLSFAGFQLLGGRCADLFGERRLFVIGLGLFTLANLVGGLATSPAVLVGARIVQGLGSAALAPTTMTVISSALPEGPRRTRGFAAWTATGSVGGAAGAVLGGVLTDAFGWRWTLLVKVPIGLVGTVLAWFALRDRPTGGHRLDVPGALLVTIGLGSAVYGITTGQAHGWGSTATVLALTLGLVLLAVFWVHESRWAAEPLLPPSFFRIASVGKANALMFCLGVGFYSSWYLLSLYLQNVLGYSALVSGLAFVPLTAAIVVGAQLAGGPISRWGAKPVVLGGLMISTAGFFALAFVRAGSSYPVSVLLPGLVFSLGSGAAFTGITVLATSGVPSKVAGLASGVLSTTKQVCGSVAIAAMSTVAAGRTSAALADRQPPAEALAAGYGWAFGIGAVFALFAVLLALRLPGHRQRPEPAAAGERAESGQRGQ